MNTDLPIVTAEGMLRPYMVSLSGNIGDADILWQVFVSLFKKAKDSEKEKVLSEDKFGSFDSYGNALKPENAWVKIKTPMPCRIRTIKWQNGYKNGRVRKFTFQGSNNDITWVDLPLLTEVSPDPNNPEINECVFDTAAKYTYYRFVVNEVYPFNNGGNPLYAVLERIDLLDAIIDVKMVVIETAINSIEIGETKTLTAAVGPENATFPNIRWYSSDKAKAIVGEKTGIVTGVSAGEVTITAIAESYDSKRAQCRVRVGLPPPDKVASIRILDAPTEPLKVGSSTTIINVEVSPKSALNKELTWTVARSSTHNVVSVNSEAINAARITAKNPGTATVRARSKCNIIETADCEVTVVKPVKIYLSPENINKRLNNKGFDFYGYERDQMILLTDMVSDYLSSRGYDVTVGRNEEATGVSYATGRCTESNSMTASNPNGTNLHVCIHSNGSSPDGVTEGTASGPEIYRQNRNNKNSVSSEIFAQTVFNKLFALYKKEKDFVNAIPRGVKESFYDKYANGQPIYTSADYYEELRDVNAIAIYVETAFHDNLKDARWIYYNMDSIAQAIGGGIIEYINL